LQALKSSTQNVVQLTNQKYFSVGNPTVTLSSSINKKQSASVKASLNNVRPQDEIFNNYQTEQTYPKSQLERTAKLNSSQVKFSRE
jgi:hypothetical protein